MVSLMMPDGKQKTGPAITLVDTERRARSSQLTHLEILYDDKNIYVTIRAFDI